jgi:hypothetical protein
MFTCRGCVWGSDNVKDAIQHHRTPGHAVLKWVGPGSFQDFGQQPEAQAQ